MPKKFVSPIYKNFYPNLFLNFTYKVNKYGINFFIIGKFTIFVKQLKKSKAMLTRDEMNDIENTILTDAGVIAIYNEMKSHKGKEIGHTFASILEDLIADIMVRDYGCQVPRDKSGKKLSRALGDLIFPGGNLINIKSGVDKKGQPNMCSMTRIMKEFVKNETIDSYTIIKYKIVNGEISISVFDMFDVIDYLCWNSGTGQIMLSEEKFYKFHDKNAEKLTIEEKQDKIISLYKKGADDHINLRIKQRDDMMKMVTEKRKNNG